MTGQALRVAVVGGGVLGLVSALRLVQHGAIVTVYEAAPDRPNASSVAAGMIAPATECALEPALCEVAPSLRAARIAWMGLANELGVTLIESGSIHAGSAGVILPRKAELERLGFAVEDCTLQFATSDDDHGASIFLSQDALIATGPALAALRAAVVRAGGALQAGRVQRDRDGFTANGERLAADAVILATGAPGRTSGLAPELARLVPIKGQLLRWPGPGKRRPVLRLGWTFYLTSQREEIIAGATMEEGRDDLIPEPDALDLYRAEAEDLIAGLRDRIPELCIGIRADTPDGLPMVGPSITPGVVLATGARRNGWLFAPPVAAIVCAHVLGLPLGELAPLADRLHPGRFTDGEAT